MRLLGPGEVRILEVLSKSEETSVGQIADKLGITASVVSREVSKLEKKRLVMTLRSKVKSVFFSDNSAAISLQELFSANPHVNFSKVISNSNLQVLSAICYRDSARMDSISRVCCLPVVTCRRCLSELGAMGVVWHRNGEYGISLPKLRDFVCNYCQLLFSLKTGGSRLRSGVVAGPQAVFRMKKDVVGLAPTGSQEYARFGINLILPDLVDYYAHAFRKPSKPCLEEVVAYGLFENTVFNSPREYSYALLVIAKNSRKFNWKKFELVTSDLGISQKAGECRQFFSKDYNDNLVNDLPGVGPACPSRSEFMELCRQYGVDTKTIFKKRY
jgi:predicted transcriptional regulator